MTRPGGPRTSFQVEPPEVAPARVACATARSPTPPAGADVSPARVLFLGHTAVLGGAEIALLRLVGAIDRTRFVPVVVLFSDGLLVEHLARLSVETHVLPLAPGIVNARKDTLGPTAILRMRDIAVTFGYVYRLARLIRSLGVDLVHANTLKADVIGGLAATLAGRPVIWHVHELLQSGYLPAFARRAFLALGRTLPNHILTNSHSTLSYLLPGRRDRMSVVHPGIDVRPRTPAKGPSPLARPVVGLVGRIAPFKGQHVFIRAAARVLAEFPSAKFKIVGGALFGEDVYEQSLRALAATLGLDGAIEFTGFRDDARCLIRDVDVLVHASVLGEGFGQVVIEGMAAGKPIVATNGGAIPEIIEDGVTGLLVPMGDDQAMARAICSLLSDPARATEMGQIGRRRVLQKFTVEQTAEKVQSVYEGVLRASNGDLKPRLRRLAIGAAYLGALSQIGYYEDPSLR
jgi:glycosyltransferase involved in cell wall biosynthesis